MSESQALKNKYAHAVLDWYQQMGVDEVLSDAGLNWYDVAETQSLAQEQERVKPHTISYAHDQKTSRAFTPQKSPTPPPLKQQPNETRPQAGQVQSLFAHAPHDSAVLEAREKARSCQTLQELEEILHGFDGCSLKKTAKNICISRGSSQADLMLIGEAPGRDEDMQGRPFVGRAGQLLDKMLAAIGYDEQSVYITNIVYWRPPGNRTPTPQEAQVCAPFLERQIELVAPKVVLFLGGAAAKHMLNTTEGIMRLRGKWKSFHVNDHAYKALATLHPAYLLRNPVSKRQAWQDLLKIKNALGESE